MIAPQGRKLEQCVVKSAENSTIGARLGARLKRNRATLFWLCVIVSLGFYTKFYSGPAANWVHNSLGGVFYELFWCLLAVWVFPRTSPWRIAVTVLLFTCALEFLQLWHPGFLQLVRGYFIGQALLGDSFARSDFTYYFVGSALGWVWIKRLRRRYDCKGHAAALVGAQTKNSGSRHS
jgi:hypothetical protein